MRDTKKIKEFSRKTIKATKIIRVLLYISFVFALLTAIATGIFYSTQILENWIQANADMAKDITISLGKEAGIVFIKDTITLYELFESGLIKTALKELCEATINGCISIGLSIALTYVIEKLFVSINDSETPLKKEFVKQAKNVFILITVIVFFQSILAGIVVGLALSCVYYIYSYGVELQTEADETI